MESMLRRWICHDVGRRHSLAVTRQLRTPLPHTLQDLVRRSGGSIHRLNSRPGGLLSWAAKLRQIAHSHDLVILHLWADDIIPTIALADKSVTPPILLIDHCDHTFWLGGTVSDMVVALRKSGQRLAQNRRYVPEERSVLLPTIVERSSRVYTREQAKRILGLPANCVLLVSIARKAKYASFQGKSYLDAHVSILRKHDQAILFIVGAGNRDDWRSTITEMKGRIFSIPEKLAVGIYLQAADVFVDAFPMVSITSLLEAGLYGLPLVSRSLFSIRSEILLADAPGLDGYLLQAELFAAV